MLPVCQIILDSLPILIYKALQKLADEKIAVLNESQSFRSVL